MMNFWKRTADKLESGKMLFLMVVIKSEGSSPGKAGFKTVVSEDGDIWGSIGGGAMEYRLAEHCRRLIKQKSTTIFLQKQDHHPDSKEASSGMICSGVQWIGFYPLTSENKTLIRQIENIEINRLPDVVSFTEAGIMVTEPRADNNYPISQVNKNQWIFAEQPGIRNKLFIFGAGHVSLALSKMAKEIGFDITLFDNRKQINTFEENTFADKKTVINYSDAWKNVPEGNHVFVVIMTFAHQSDTQILRQMLPKKIKYLGMMGSELKVQSVFEMLQNEGTSKNDLSKIDAPIGLDINSITPAEIAISIMAKIIKVKNNNV